jgi:hypothetical protein
VSEVSDIHLRPLVCTWRGTALVSCLKILSLAVVIETSALRNCDQKRTKVVAAMMESERPSAAAIGGPVNPRMRLVRAAAFR